LLDLDIECLRMEIRDAAGHESRLQGIARRAAELLAERLEILYGSGGTPPPQSVATLKARPVSLDLNRTSDENAARAVADAWLDSLAMRLKQ
jgi:hypothetical protein